MMPDSALETQDYKMYLNNLLLALKNQVDAQTRTVTAPVAGLDSLDDYLLELNTFYYKSFHDRYFPYYEQIIKEDMRNLLHLSQDEAVLKKNILASLKQYARLFNQASHIISRLENKRQETQTLLWQYSMGSEERNVSLLYYLKDMADNWNSLLTLIKNLQVILQDDMFIAALKKYPVNAAVANLIRKWNPDSSREVRDFNRLLAAWKLAATLLAKFQDVPASTKESYEMLIQEIKQADLNWDNRKVQPVFRTWYQQYIQQTYRLYWEYLNLNAEQREPRRISQTAGQFGDWLNSLLVVIEQSMAYKSRGWGELIHQPVLLTEINKEYLREMETYTSRLLESIDELIRSLSSSTRANYQNHSERAGALLHVAGEHLREQLENRPIPQIQVINSALQGLKNQNDYMEMGIELLNDKEEHSVNACNQCQTVLATLDAYLDLLTAVKEDLNRMLSPRHLKNIYQKVDLKVEHASIATGSHFPHQYDHLIVEKMIETEAADVTEGQILYNEGDIFVFHLDDLTISEIPKIIIAKKG